MTPERRAMMVRLAEAHDAFVDEQLPGAPFHPGARPAGSDYNQHHVDLDADTDAFHDRARLIVGI